jgi:hypothetical protein
MISRISRSKKLFMCAARRTRAASAPRPEEALGGDLDRLEVETRFDPSGRSGTAVATLSSASDRQARVHLSGEMDESGRWRLSLDRFEEP